MAVRRRTSSRSRLDPDLFLDGDGWRPETHVLAEPHELFRSAAMASASWEACRVATWGAWLDDGWPLVSPPAGAVHHDGLVPGGTARALAAAEEFAARSPRAVAAIGEPWELYTAAVSVAATQPADGGIDPDATVDELVADDAEVIALEQPPEPPVPAEQTPPAPEPVGQFLVNDARDLERIREAARHG